ncbi:YueH family protein [Staphylococcus petrasii]|uniref:YueH family protein n=1 Tax=Staphylococcus petrasii TaxID=1276936 RepID=UPI001F56BA85|nr:YueH family protein [Staphylococcus petrasii]MCI2773469.1 YueH family protein [Staphylococcus petrasii]
MKIKQLSEQNEVVNVYLYKNDDIEQLMIAIPDMFWSVEIDYKDMNINEIEEELVMQLFTFKDENEATRIASKLSEWIANDLKENIK